jgi:hypothetical protein
MDEQQDGITAYHGSPHDFDEFDTSKIGTGEGAQAYGHGLYFAEHEPIAKDYRDKLVSGQEVYNAMLEHFGEYHPHAMNTDVVDTILSAQRNDKDIGESLKSMAAQKAKSKWDSDVAVAPHYAKLAEDKNFVQAMSRPFGHMYEVHINAHPDHMLDWDKPLRGQQHIMNAIDQHIGDPNSVLEHLFGHLDATGGDLHEKLGGQHKPKAVSEKLSSMGIKGIKYLDAGSRSDKSQQTHNYVVFDHKDVAVRRKYEQGGAVEGYEDGGEVDDDIPNIQNPISVFPKPQRMFPEENRPAGGQYLNAKTKEDMTGHKAAQASIGIAPGGKPTFNVSPDAVEQTGSRGKGTRMSKTNLFKQKAGWKWLEAPEGHEDTNTIISVHHGDDHHYALNAHYPKGVDLAKYPDRNEEPRLRPTTKGKITFGNQVGTISVRGKEHPVYNHVIVKAAGGEVESYADGGSTDMDNDNNNNVTSLGEVRDQRELQNFHKDFMGGIKDRANTLYGALDKAHEQGVFEGYNVGDRFLTPQHGPMKITGHLMRKYNPNNKLMNNAFQKHGVPPTLVEHEGEHYYPMLRVESGHGDDFTTSDAYLDLTKHFGYPRMGGIKRVKRDGGPVGNGPIVKRALELLSKDRTGR